MTKRVVSVILVLMLVCSIPMNMALAAVCPKCRNSEKEGARFCGKCGTRLPISVTTPTPTPKSTPNVTKRPTVTATPIKLSAVTDLKVTKAAKDSISISWKKANNAQKYVVEYKESSDTQWKEATSSCKKEKYTIKKLKAGTRYDIRVCAVNGKIKSDYNELTNNATMAAATPKPTKTPKPTMTPKPTAKTTPKPDSEKLIKVGDYVTFGTYPQTASGNDNTPIEWLVLEVNGNKAFFLSRYVLDAQKFNEKGISVTWETCTLRRWLNNTFMTKAFTNIEQRAIYSTNVVNGQGEPAWFTSGNNNTQDKIFLLSYAEINKYFTNKSARKCTPTNYAIKQSKHSQNWWLRSLGRDAFNATAVYSGGTIQELNWIYDIRGVRPAMWVNLESGIF